MISSIAEVLMLLMLLLAVRWKELIVRQIMIEVAYDWGALDPIKIMHIYMINLGKLSYLPR